MALDIFEQILFGNGAWIGFTLLTIMCFAGIVIYKYIGVFTSIMFILLGVRYLELYTAGDNNLTWFWAFSWVVSFMQIMFMLKVKK